MKSTVRDVSLFAFVFVLTVSLCTGAGTADDRFQPNEHRVHVRARSRSTTSP